LQIGPQVHPNMEFSSNCCTWWRYKHYCIACIRCFGEKSLHLYIHT